MIRQRLVPTIMATLIALGAVSASGQSTDVQIFIEASPVGESTDNTFNVSVALSSQGDYEAIPVTIMLPWWVETGLAQCVGACTSPVTGNDRGNLTTALTKGFRSQGTVVFTMSVIDDTYSAAGISVRAGDSKKSLIVPIAQPSDSQQDELGGVNIVTLLHDSERNDEFVIEFDAHLPLSGGAFIVIPPGLTPTTDSTCVDATTREPSTYNQACEVIISEQPSGETWLQVFLPNGIYSVRIVVAPEPDFDQGTIAISVGGRYFESEVVDVDVPGDFEGTHD